MDDQAATEKIAAALQAVSGPWPMRPEEFAAALLPVVREIAADEIERIADERTWVTEHDNEVVSARDLYEHIAHLRGELEPVSYDFPPDDPDELTGRTT